MLSNFAPRTLLLLFPVLVATELAVVARATAEGWLTLKLRAWGSLLVHGRSLLRWRAGAQRHRRVTDREILELFCGGMQTELVQSRLLGRVNPWLEAYRGIVLRLLEPRPTASR